ncbi:4009_t:CDS:2, partial [Racocetra fulgida]
TTPTYHRLTPYIEVLKEVANICNKKAICQACVEFKGHAYALEEKFINTKSCCKAIIDDTDSETTLEQHRNKRLHINIDEYNFMIQNFKEADLDKFCYLLLKATISNDWSFQWVDNSDSIVLFQFTNSVANDTILRCASNQLVYNIQQKAQNDIYGVTLILDGWTNIVNQSILGSVLVTSSGKVLVWEVKEVNSNCMRKADPGIDNENNQSNDLVLPSSICNPINIQIKDVMNQAYRNHELKQIKQIYESKITLTLLTKNKNQDLEDEKDNQSNTSIESNDSENEINLQDIENLEDLEDLEDKEQK